MDPIIKEAMKRSSQMQGPVHKKEKQEKNESKSIPEPIKEISSVKEDNSLETFIKNKDQSLIFLLLILLVKEDSDPSALLVLLYLLI